MSIPVSLERLGEEIAERDRAPYLLTVSAEGRPHAVAVAVTVGPHGLTLGAGRRTTANAARSPLVSLIWPPAEIDGYTLIVDGEACVSGDTILVAPSGAVLHRPAPAPAGSASESAESACGSDCVPLAPRPG